MTETRTARVRWFKRTGKYYTDETVELEVDASASEGARYLAAHRAARAAVEADPRHGHMFALLDDEEGSDVLGFPELVTPPTED